MKKILSALLAAILVLSLAACGGKSGATEAPTAGAEDKVLRVASTGDMATMDVAQTTDDYFVPQNIFDRLFEIQVQADGSTEIVGSLCTEHSVTDDGLSYTFKLRQGVKFTNGNPLTAGDVKYTFVRLLTAGGVNDDIPLEVAGAEALQKGEAEDLSGINVVNDYELTVTLSAPNAGFLAELTAPAMSIVDEETCKSVQNFGMEPADTIGSGPYIITEWVANDHYTLVRNEDYWGEKPDVKKVIMKIVPDANTQNLMFQNGELDILDLDNLDASVVTGTYKTTYKDRLVSGRRVGVTYLAMNENNRYLSDKNVRKAVQLAVNRQKILDDLYGGDGILENGIIATGVWGHNEDLPEIVYDPGSAKALLAEAGYAEGEITFELALSSDGGTVYQMVYQQIQQDLAAVGISATIKSYDESAWLELRKSGEMDAFVATWTMDYNDPANIMATFFGSAAKTKGRSLNYSDEAVMDRVAAASAIVDDEARRKEYQDLEYKIVVEDAAWVPMYERTHLFALGENVASFIPHWAGYTNFFVRDVTLK